MSRPLRARLHDIIFQHDDPTERAFDVAVLIAILASVLVVMLDSVVSVSARYGDALRIAEWVFTVLFTIEYILRLWTARHPARYARSFYGVVDLLAVLPTYLAIFFPAGRFLIAVRVLRVLRIFRILKLARYVSEAAVLGTALRASRFKITVFLSTVLSVVVVVGSLMYLIEGPAAGFTSIPQSIYWAIVTITTVGYGDMAPATPPGKLLASVLMVLGYGIIAVPTGIVTLELDRASRLPVARRSCPGCGVERHDSDARYCRYCGSEL
ncbi:MAG TPA: ion transporter [Gemmatimonadaceae bacterium]|jgi:voltage-gated potassium channel|nr:ion transporter [Gemmatimonadaceae bacterium]